MASCFPCRGHSGSHESPAVFFLAQNNSKRFQGSSRHARDFVVGGHQEACSGSGVDVCSRGFVLPRVGWGRALDVSK